MIKLLLVVYSLSWVPWWVLPVLVWLAVAAMTGRSVVAALGLWMRQKALTTPEAAGTPAVYRQAGSEHQARIEHGLTVPERPVSWSWLPVPTELEEARDGQ